VSEIDIGVISLAAMRQRHSELSHDIIRTPTVRLNSPLIHKILDGGSVYLKLECFQHTGTFKARGALSAAKAIPETKRAAGITAASAGNHAIAASWAARKQGLSAKVVMLSSASPFRIAWARAEQAEVILKDGSPATFAEAERLMREEGRTFIHPFEGPDTVLGTAGVGLEILEDAPDFDAIIVAVGGGGLIGGIAAAVKATSPACKVYGVEPAGADSMSQSLKAGKPVTLSKIDTIVDSLAPPMELPLVHALSTAYVDEIATVTDDDICAGMVVMQEEAKLAVEPAAAAPMTALLSPLRDRLKGKTVGLVVCGANIDTTTYLGQMKRGRMKVDSLTAC
jgi:threonine dehydratase